MRFYSLMAACAISLVLAGCAGSGFVNPFAPKPVAGTTTTTPPTGSTIIADTVTDAKQLCQYVPAAETIGGILASGNPYLTTAAAIAEAICNAVTNKSASYGSGGPAVEGVRIQGYFLKKSSRYRR